MNGIATRKLNFAHLPTPLERLDRLSAHLAGPTIWMKRDDRTGLSFGGNKARKLEYILQLGSGGTHAGIVAGLLLLRSSASARGISVGPPRVEIEPVVFSLATEAAKHVDAACRIDRSQVDGYGVAGPRVAEAVLLLARLEGIVLDPVYTGKAMGALIDLVKQGVYTRENHVVFIHTGGGPAMFAYEHQIAGWAAAFDACGSPASCNQEAVTADRVVS